MKLWLLRPVEGLPKRSDLNPWHPWYDLCLGMVVAAPTEEAARHLDGWEAWKDPSLSTCVELVAADYAEAQIIIKDEHWA
jgi:hypothetical protein